jgi:hypothetical protein
VAMPFAPDFKEIYRIVKNACDSLNLIPVRTDELPLVGNVVEIIREGIASCECAVAVITGQNPNVMYDLGLQHALPHLRERSRRAPAHVALGLANARCRRHRLSQLRRVSGPCGGQLVRPQYFVAAR